jgi:pimeloyl-ACP methyl ester carboxylesterase
MSDEPWDGFVMLGNGRRFGYREFGDAEGHPVFMLHGTPGSRMKFAVVDSMAKARGLRIVAPDRWGYGLTQPHPTPSLTAFARDIAEVASYVGAPEFSVVGISGGGPYASAIAATLPTRVTSLALVSPVGPIVGTGIEGTLSPMHRFCFLQAARHPAWVARAFVAYRGALKIAPKLACNLATFGSGPADRAVMADGATSTRLLASFLEGLKPGGDGPAIDLSIFARPWDVRLDHIRATTKVWIGTDDSNVPLYAARALAEAIPDADLDLLQSAGHLWVSSHYDEVLDWVASAAVRAAVPTAAVA